MRMIKLTGWFVLLLTSLPLHAQTHRHICASIGQSDVEVDTCRAQVRLYEDNYQRDLNAAARLAIDPQLLMTESVHALSQEVTQCLNFECIRSAYLDETQRLQTIERNAIDNAMTWMPPTASDHTNPDVHSPDTTTTHSTWAEEVPALHQPEAINAAPPHCDRDFVVHQPPNTTIRPDRCRCEILKLRRTRAEHRRDSQEKFRRPTGDRFSVGRPRLHSITLAPRRDRPCCRFL